MCEVIHLSLRKNVSQGIYRIKEKLIYVELSWRYIGSQKRQKYDKVIWVLFK